MAARIRLRRMGKNKKPFYRIVVADSKAPRDGKFIETLGHFNPFKYPDSIVLNEERTKYWLSNGVKPTEAVRKLLKKKGINVNSI